VECKKANFVFGARRSESAKRQYAERSVFLTAIAPWLILKESSSKGYYTVKSDNIAFRPGQQFNILKGVCPW